MHHVTKKEENKTCFELSDQTRKVSVFSSSCDLDHKPRLGGARSGKSAGWIL